MNSVSNGGEIVDITNKISEEIKELPLSALAAFPGLYTGGLDIMMKSFDDTDPTVIEANTFPVLSIPTLPTYGKGTNPTKNYFESVIAYDQYLTNTKYKYDIENYEDYINNYLSFTQRKQKLLAKILILYTLYSQVKIFIQKSILIL